MGWTQGRPSTNDAKQYLRKWTKSQELGLGKIMLQRSMVNPRVLAEAGVMTYATLHDACEPKPKFSAKCYDTSRAEAQNCDHKFRLALKADILYMLA